MLPEIVAGKTDDTGFVALVNTLVHGLTKDHVYEHVWLIQIDNWFDHKWLRFSGRGTVDFQFPAFMNTYDAAIDEFYQDKLTFPPFSPNRVAGQWSYSRVGDRYEESPLALLPHPTVRRRSEMNLQRRVQQFSRSACFIWYSANTAKNGRGSVMVYVVATDEVQSWFAAFNRKAEWKLNMVKGTNLVYVQRLLNAS